MQEAFTELPWLLYVCLLTLGMLVGSFLNVVIYRLPLMIETRWRSDCCELLEVEKDKPKAKSGRSRRQTPTEAAVKSFLRSMSTTLGREIMRGILGVIKKG